MNLSEHLCVDKELFSEENNMNLSEHLCVDKELFSEENNMNLSEHLCVDKELFSEENTNKQSLNEVNTEKNIIMTLEKISKTHIKIKIKKK